LVGRIIRDCKSRITSLHCYKEESMEEFILFLFESCGYMLVLVGGLVLLVNVLELIFGVNWD
jgi:hypothetical protein